MQFTEFWYIFHSSLKELERGDGRKKVAGAPRIIPGDWGMVEAGWLAQPL
jgi:hypothetical protein